MPDAISATGATPATSGVDVNALLGGVPAEKPSTVGTATFDKDMFLKLLVAQIKNQDPSKPMDSAQFMSQAATLAQVESMQAVQQAQVEQTSWQRSLAASALVGRQVTGQDATGITVTGVVEKVLISSVGVELVVAGKQIPLTAVSEVSVAPQS